MHNLNGWPGIDIQSFGSLLFLPGTQRPKYNGAGYKIIFDNLDGLADGGDPDGAAALAGWVAEQRVSREDFEPSAPWDGKPPDERQAAYLNKMLRNMHSKLSIIGKESVATMRSTMRRSRSETSLPVLGLTKHTPQRCCWMPAITTD